MADHQQQQLNNSLTSMDWLYRLSSHKPNGLNIQEPNGKLILNQQFNPCNSGSSNDSDTFSLATKMPENFLIHGNMANKNENIIIKKETSSDIVVEEVSSTTSPSITLNGKKPVGSKLQAAVIVGPAQTSAQRAEPHRPIDLNAEYRGGDHSRREGKPPYSYVNLITFAINSTSKKRMTLNEIYQWIAENFHYYRNAGNGWKVIAILAIFF
jgi:hypothetical protein